MQILDWLFFGPARLIAWWAYAGVLVGAVLIGMQLAISLYLQKPMGKAFFREAAVFAGILWLIFNAFELQMSAIAAKSDTQMLRMDLIILVPILYVLTAAGVVSLIRQMGAHAKTNAVAETDSESGDK